MVGVIHEANVKTCLSVNNVPKNLKNPFHFYGHKEFVVRNIILSRR